MLQCIRTKILEAGLNTKEDLRFHSKLIHVKDINSRKQGKQWQIRNTLEIAEREGTRGFFLH